MNEAFWWLHHVCMYSGMLCPYIVNDDDDVCFSKFSIDSNGYMNI